MCWLFYNFQASLISTNESYYCLSDKNLESEGFLINSFFSVKNDELPQIIKIIDTFNIINKTTSSREREVITFGIQTNQPFGECSIFKTGTPDVNCVNYFRANKTKKCHASFDNRITITGNATKHKCWIQIKYIRAAGN